MGSTCVTCLCVYAHTKATSEGNVVEKLAQPGQVLGNTTSGNLTGYGDRHSSLKAIEMLDEHNSNAHHSRSSISGRQYHVKQL